MNNSIDILLSAREKGRLVLSGNRESFDYLEYKKDCWWQTSGDTVSGEETVIRIDDKRALELIVQAVRERLGMCNPDSGALSDLEIVKCLKSCRF